MSNTKQYANIKYISIKYNIIRNMQYTIHNTKYNYHTKQNYNMNFMQSLNFEITLVIKPKLVSYICNVKCIVVNTVNLCISNHFHCCKSLVLLSFCRFKTLYMRQSSALFEFYIKIICKVKY